MSVVQPMYRITRNGKALPAWMYLLITKVVFKETDGNGANQSMEILFNDPEFQVMDGGYFTEKKTKIKTEMGYVDGNDFGVVFDGKTQEVVNDYPVSGMVTLKIIARDTAYSMSESEKTKTWKGKTYSDIAKELLKKHGISCTVDSTAKILPRKKNGQLTKVVQSQLSDLAFIQNMANKCHYTFVIDSTGNKAWFVKSKDKVKQSNVTVVVDYKEGNEKLKSFRPKFNDYKRAMNVKASNINIDKAAVVDKKGTKTKKKKTKKKKDETPKNTRRTYTVKSGDCLWNIAKKFYGNGASYTKIYEANKNIIKNLNLIYAGWVLVIPD